MGAPSARGPHDDKPSALGAHHHGGDERLRRLQDERSTLKGSEEKLRKEIRSLNAREKQLQAEVENLRVQVQEIPALRKHFDLLVKEHGASKERRQQIANDLRKELASTKANAAERSQALADVGKELEDVNRSADIQRHRADAAEGRLEAYRASASDLVADLTDAAVDLLADRAQVAPKHVKRLQGALHAARLRSHRLQRQVADRDAQTTALVDFAQHLEEERDSWRDEAGQLEADLASLNRAAAKERSFTDRAGRQSAEQLEAAHARLIETADELAMLKLRLEVESDTNRIVTDATALRISLFTDELQATRSALYEADKEANTFRGQVPALQAQLKDAQDALASIREEMRSVQHEKEEAIKAKVKTNAALAEAVEARTRLTGLLTQSRAAETALEGELASAEASLEDLAGLQEAHLRLRQTLETLVARSDLAERDAATVAQLNADLGGHASTQQKIHHLARVRAELAEMRKKHASATAELAAAKREADSLREEVASYKAVGGQLAPASKLSRVLRPLMNDLQNRR